VFNDPNLSNDLLAETYYNNPPEHVDKVDPKNLTALPRDVPPEAMIYFSIESWTFSEASCLDPQGKPYRIIITVSFPSTTPHIIELTSQSAYLSGYNMTKIGEFALKEQIRKDYAAALSSESVTVSPSVISVDVQPYISSYAKQAGVISLDQIELEPTHYRYTPSLLVGALEQENVKDEVLTTSLLRCVCPPTKFPQPPDYADVLITYSGKKINHEKLLAYLISFRKEPLFLEALYDRIVRDLYKYCSPDSLRVENMFVTRRGMDFTSTHDSTVKALRITK